MKIRGTIYLDHQATTPVDERVQLAMQPYYCEQFGNSHSADHVFGWESAQAIRDATVKIGDMVGADADEVIFTSGGTESNNLALLGLSYANLRSKRNRIFISEAEHKSVLATAQFLQNRLGYVVETLPVNQDGVLDICVLKNMLDDKVLLVSTILVNNEIGSINPVKEIYATCLSHGALLHCDGVQAPVAMDLSDISDYVDFLSLSSHKMYGPKGVGALFIRRPIQANIEPMIWGGGQQGNLRSGTLPTPLCVGMGVAANLLVGHAAFTEREKLKNLRNDFVSLLEELPWPIRVNGPELSNRHPGNAHILFEGFSAKEILTVLQPHLAASTGSACMTGSSATSHVLVATGLDKYDADSSIRFSLGRKTTMDDVKEAIMMLKGALEKVSGASLKATI